MAGVRESKKKRTREKIVGVAGMLFQQKGYENVSMEEIAVHSEIGVGTLYNYFANKGDVFIAAFVGLTKSQERTVPKVEIGKESAGEILFCFALEYLYSYFGNFGIQLTKSVFQDMLLAGVQSFRSDNKIMDTFLKEDMAFIEELEKLIRELQKIKKMREDYLARDVAENIYGAFAFEILAFVFWGTGDKKQVESRIKRKIYQIVS